MSHSNDQSTNNNANTNQPEIPETMEELDQLVQARLLHINQIVVQETLPQDDGSFAQCITFTYYLVGHSEM
jgi:hypothetical protein